jgi:hypothetical protein
MSSRKENRSLDSDTVLHYGIEIIYFGPYALENSYYNELDIKFQ